jgi:hypothetical protein
MAKYTKWHDELKHTLCQSGSVGNSPQMSNANRTKVPKPETRSQLERAQTAHPYADSSSAEIERSFKAPFERVLRPLSSSKSNASAVIIEQSRKTVLNREPPKGSSLIGSKSSGRTVSEGSFKTGRVLPAVAKAVLPNVEITHSRPSPLQPTSSGQSHTRATLTVAQKVSTPETRNSLERAHKARPTASPSSSMPDSPSVPSKLTKSLPRNASEPLTVGPRPLKSSPKMVSPIHQPLLVPSLSIRAKAQEQSIKTGLDRELPNRSPLIDKMPPSEVVSSSSSKRGGNHSFPANSTQNKLNIIITCRVMDETTHRELETSSIVSGKTSSLRFDGIPLLVVPGRRTPSVAGTKVSLKTVTTWSDKTFRGRMK